MLGDEVKPPELLLKAIHTIDLINTIRVEKEIDAMSMATSLATNMNVIAVALGPHKVQANSAYEDLLKADKSDGVEADQERALRLVLHKALACDTASQVGRQNAVERHYLGETTIKIGLEPFIAFPEDGGEMLAGTSVATFTDLNTVSLDLRIPIQTNVEYQTLVELCGTQLGGYTFERCSSRTERFNLVELLRSYKTTLLSALGLREVSTYSLGIYTVLSLGADVGLDQAKIFRFIKHPVYEDSAPRFRPEYVRDAVHQADLSTHSNLGAWMGEHRMLLDLSKIMQMVKAKATEAPGICMFEMQVQWIVPLYRALGSVCVLESIRATLKNVREYDQDTSTHLKTLVNTELARFGLAEDYRYNTVTEMIERMRACLHYDVLRGRVSDSLKALDEVLERKQADCDEQIRNGVGFVLSLLTAILSIEPVMLWLAFVKNTYPEWKFNETIAFYVIWGALVVITCLIYGRLLRRKKVRVMLGSVGSGTSGDDRNRGRARKAAR